MAQKYNVVTTQVTTTTKQHTTQSIDNQYIMYIVVM